MDELHFLPRCHGPSLPFPQHVHGLDSDQGTVRRSPRLEAQHRSDPTFDEPMILLDGVVQILAHPMLDRGIQISHVDLLGNRDFGCRILVGVDHPGHPVVPRGQRLPQQPPRFALVAIPAEQEVDRVAVRLRSASPNDGWWCGRRPTHART